MSPNELPPQNLPEPSEPNPCGHRSTHRLDHDPPPVTTQLGWRYHHIGIPTDKPLPEEDYDERYKLYASGYSQSPYGVEWMRFDPDCPLPELVKTVPHVAFVVEDVEAAIAGKEVLIEPNSPSEGVTVAFIVDHGAPIELLQFHRPEAETWPHASKFKIT